MESVTFDLERGSVREVNQYLHGDSAVLKGQQITVSSPNGALAEIAGDAAILVDPYDVAALSRSIRALAQDDDLFDHYCAAGPKRAAEFSFEKYAERMSSVYRNLSH